MVCLISALGVLSVVAFLLPVKIGVAYIHMYAICAAIGGEEKQKGT